MVLDRKKTPKEVYDWLMDEVSEYHEGNREVTDKLFRE